MFVIGTDEAGYGPNLGPLVIAATVWHVPSSVGDDADLYQLLKEGVTHVADRTVDDDRLVMADSKCVYRPKSGLRSLETPVLSSIFACGEKLNSWRQLLDFLQITLPDSSNWYHGFDPRLPIAVTGEQLVQSSSRLRQALDGAGVSLVNLRGAAVFPSEFNQRVKQLGTKGRLLSEQTIRLVRTLTQSLDGAVSIFCDKHGGRNRYAGLLQQFFPDILPVIDVESRNESRYRLNDDGRILDFRFSAKGERFLPVALASMTAKYVRELAMRAFNDFWSLYVPGLKPTAGYPLDAKRFKFDIESAQAKLGILDSQLWRRQ